MSDSSDDEPIALKRRKVEHTNGTTGSERQAARKSQPVSYKEDSDDDDDEPLIKKAAAPKVAKSAGAKVKKEPVVKKETGAKRNSTGAKKTAVKKETKDSKPAAVKREKKQYDLPGQTRETPDETDPLRKFYSSLLEQRADSMMAKKWLCMHGLLSSEDAEAYLAEVGKVKSPDKRKPSANSSKRATPSKPRKSNAAPSSTKKKIKKEASSDEESEDEFIVAKKPAAKKPVAKKAVQRRSSGVKTEGVSVKKEAGVVKPKLSKKDVAFDDGGLGGSSDDDIPLAIRKAA